MQGQGAVEGSLGSAAAAACCVDTLQFLHSGTILCADFCFIYVKDNTKFRHYMAIQNMLDKMQLGSQEWLIDFNIYDSVDQLKRAYGIYSRQK